MSRHAGVGLVVGLVWHLAVARGDDVHPPAEPRSDCGAKALAFLFQIEGRPVDLDRIEATLDEGPAGRSTGPGRSMRDLRDAAGRLGLTLDGVRWPDGGRVPDRPVIAYLDRKPHGHFVLVWPAGHSGQLVQVLDGEAEPRVVDAARLVGLPEWTGLILEPRRANWPLRLGGGAAGIAVIASTWLRVRRRRTVDEASGAAVGA